MIKKYRKKPVEIEAIQWRGSHDEPAVTEFIRPDARARIEPYKNRKGAWVLYTQKAKMFFGDNDYIIRGIEGEYYVCKHTVFAETYEVVDVAN